MEKKFVLELSEYISRTFRKKVIIIDFNKRFGNKTGGLNFPENYDFPHVMNSIVSSSQLSVMEAALGASALRHKVISDNIANVNTPGFKKSEVSFEDQLDEVLNGDGKKVAIVRTHEKHLPPPERQLLPRRPRPSR